MPEWCTMASADYLARALVLHRSLAAWTSEVRLRVLCLDETTRSVLSTMDLRGVCALSLRDLEELDPALREVRPQRTAWEYAMTVKPSLCRYALERCDAGSCVAYVDADLMFFGEPYALVEELGEGSALLVPHRYPPERGWMAEAWGRFNAGTVLLRPGEEAEQALRWWRERCLEWCHRGPEPGRWADQRYLDEWPGRFPGVRVAQRHGIGLAPWNGSRHELSRADGAVLVDGRPLVFYHHQGLRLHRGPAALRRLGLRADRYRLLRGRSPLVWRLEGKHTITPAEEKLVWAPYLRALREATDRARRVDPAVPEGFAEPLEVAALRREARRVGRRWRGWSRRARRRARRALRRRSKRVRRILRHLTRPASKSDR